MCRFWRHCGNCVSTPSGELGPGWLRRQKGHLKPSSYQPLESTWRLRVEPRWGGVSLSDIRPSAVQAWLSDLSVGDQASGIKPLSASVVIRTHQVLNAILADAVKDRLLGSNPPSGMRLPKKSRKRPLYLTHDQIAALADASGDHGIVVLLLAYTGIRWGEMAALRLRDLDMLRRRITIAESATQVGSQIYLGTTKGHKHRSVPFPSFLAPELGRACEGKSRDDLVFPNEDGDYLSRPHTESGWLDKAVAKAGIPRATPHDLRHTAASFAVSAGANVKALQRMLGHASAAMTLDIYAELFDDDLDSVAVALDVARGKGVSKSRPTGVQKAANATQK